MDNMKRFFVHYEKMEDVKNNLYANSFNERQIELSMKLLKDSEALLSAMRQVTKDWPIATKFNLSNTSRNRKSWLGWSACKIIHGSNMNATMMAWNRLTKQEQDKANEVAEIVIKEFEKEYAQEVA